MTDGSQAHWLAETIRLREEHWGPLDDAEAVRQARNGPDDLTARILLRARLLGLREGLDALAARWRQGAILAFCVLLLAALVAGAGSALATLGNGTRPVNALWAVGALLGLHTLTFLLWLASFTLRPAAATALGHLWLWATRKLARGPDAALVPQALMNLLGRAGALRWMFGAASHLLWLAGLGAALTTLVVLLSTASYRFVWATTLLDPDTFVRLTRALNWLPAQLGFAVLPEHIVRASDNTQALPASAQAQWSVWLLGIVAVYGVLPRLLAWLLCQAMALRALRRLQIDLALPGYAALRDRLQPPAQSTGVDRPADPQHEPRVGPGSLTALGDQCVLVGLELPGDLAWPPRPLPAGVFDAGNLDSRQDRNRLLDDLTRAGARRLLIACDARQTPDRGTLALIAALADKAGETRLWLPDDSTHAADGNTRHDTWQARLVAAGMAPRAILRDTDQPLHWLEFGHV